MNASNSLPGLISLVFQILTSKGASMESDPMDEFPTAAIPPRTIQPSTFRFNSLLRISFILLHYPPCRQTQSNFQASTLLPCLDIQLSFPLLQNRLHPYVATMFRDNCFIFCFLILHTACHYSIDILYPAASFSLLSYALLMYLSMLDKNSSSSTKAI